MSEAGCIWSLVDDIETYYETTCHNEFQFNEDGPTENGFVVCPYCGNTIQEES